MLLLSVPGTENSESDTDTDAQKQLWDDKKVQMRDYKVYSSVCELWLMFTLSSQDDASKPNACDVPGIK